MKKTATKKERDHMSAVASLGCLACLSLGFIDTPTSIHHAKRFAGDSRCHMRVIPLCPIHHQQGMLSRHGSPKEFAEKFGDDQHLLDLVESMGAQ